MFFDSWSGVGRVVLVGIPAYAALILLVRLSGKRTLSKMNAFDLVVTVALGSTLASVLTSSTVALVEGVTALVVLIALQFVVAWASVRWPAVNRLVKAEPTMLFYRGEYLSLAMRRERVTRDDIMAAVRESGIVGMSRVEAVVLGSTGDLEVLRREEPVNEPGSSAATSLDGVQIGKGADRTG